MFCIVFVLVFADCHPQNDPCIQGVCRPLYDNVGSIQDFVCDCDNGWSGRYCDFKDGKMC